MLEPFAGSPEGAQYAKAIIPEVSKLYQQQQTQKPASQRGIADIQDIIENRPPALEQLRQTAPAFGETERPSIRLLSVGKKCSCRLLALPASRTKSSVKDNGREIFSQCLQKTEEVETLETRRPLKPVIPPKPIGPREEEKMRFILSKSGITNKDIQDEYIAKSKQLQQDQYKAAAAGYESMKAYQQAKQTEDDRFFKAMEPNLDALYENLSPSLRNIWKGISRLEENAGPDEARFRNTTEI